MTPTTDPRRGFLGICVIGLVALTACVNALADDDGPVAVLESLSTLWTDPPAVSDLVPGGFSLTSTMPFPCAPYAFRPTVRNIGAELTLTVEGRYQAGCPQDITGTASFRVTVSAVPPGTYQFQLIQAHREWALAPDTFAFGAI